MPSIFLEHPCVKQLINKFFQRGVYGVQALNVRPTRETSGDLVKVVYFNPRVPVLFRIEHDVRSLLAGAETHIGFYFDVSEALGFNSLLKFGHDLF
jgi:hypothetical protein